jgi:ATP-dependent exoDNAse (exonuclease V) alpha subunit
LRSGVSKAANAAALTSVAWSPKQLRRGLDDARNDDAASQEGALGYLANGEIGIAVGQWKTRGNPKILKVEFTSQTGFTYDFYASDFREEGDAALELAYALTVHKSQGSQFRLVIVVLPEGHPLARTLLK